MRFPIGITFRHAPNDPRLAELIERECGNLEKVYARIIRCRVSLEKEQKANLPAGLYRVRGEIALPQRKKIVVKKEARINDGGYAALAMLVRETLGKAAMALERLKERRAGVARTAQGRAKQAYR